MESRTDDMNLAARPAISFPSIRVGDDRWSWDRTLLMGVVNVTPDSFSDGGRYLDPEAAVRHAMSLAAQGADVLDVGGESTRPGAASVGAAEERERVVPVIEALRARSDAVISVDTYKAEVAAAACAAGATVINDVTGGTLDSELAAVAADTGAVLVLGHIRGTPATMQHDVVYQDLVAEVCDGLAAAVERAVSAGVDRSRIVVDPGIGFGKSARGNGVLLLQVGEIRRRLARPVLVGASRKSFIGKLTGAAVDDRLAGTLAAHTLAQVAGADFLRVHDVAPARQAADLTDAVLREDETRAAAGEGAS